MLIHQLNNNILKLPKCIFILCDIQIIISTTDKQTQSDKCVCVCVCAQSLSHVQLFASPWTIAQQIPLSTGFSRQEYCSGLPFPTPGDLPHPEIEPTSRALAGEFFTTAPPGKPSSDQQLPRKIKWRISTKLMASEQTNDIDKSHKRQSVKPGIKTLGKKRAPVRNGFAFIVWE